MTARLRIGLRALCCILIPSGGLSASANDHPFIATFDRFYEQAGEAEESETATVDQSSTGGLLLLTELNCTGCHSGSEQLQAAGAPGLEDVLLRRPSEWIRRFLQSPQTVKPGTRMPDLLHELPDPMQSEHIDALLAFLAAETPAEPREPALVANALNPIPPEFWRKGSVDRGRELYHGVGCVACHAIDPGFQLASVVPSDAERQIQQLQLTDEEIREFGFVLPQSIRPVPLGNPAERFSLRSLTMFLLDPDLTHPAGRMPSLHLSPTEAADIAASLMAADNDNLPAVEFSRSSLPIRAELVAEGRRLFAEYGCANCHQHPKLPTDPAGEPGGQSAGQLALLDLQRGTQHCPGEGRGTPRFQLSTRQQQAVRKALLQLKERGAGSSEVMLSAKAALELKLLQLNCAACHQRDGRGGPGSEQWPFFENQQLVDVGDEGRIPPPLDHVGWKLTAAWLQKVLSGDGRMRPHFRTRMPAFSGHAVSLTSLLKEVDSARQIRTDNRLPDVRSASPRLLDAGRQLFDMGCVQCHAVRGELLPGVVGMDVAEPVRRLQPAWFDAFLRDPAALRNKTRMPTFFPQGRSANPGVLDGNVDQQIAALWAYLNAADQPLPEKLLQARSEDFELVPALVPIILRTFMSEESAGSQAIIVGFPEQRHLAFDARLGRPAEIWKGRFLNAYGTWFDRFAPPAIPLGEQRILLPAPAWYQMNPVNSNQSAVSLSSASLAASLASATVGGPLTTHPAKQAHPQFKGYRLDDRGVPCFLYQFHGLDIEDIIEPHLSDGLKRTLRLRQPSANGDRSRVVVWLAIAQNVLDLENATTAVTGDGLRVRAQGQEESVLLQRTADVQEWVISIGVSVEKSTLEVTYQW